MATRENAAAKKKELSAQISTLVRTLALSVLAVAWLVLSGNKDAANALKLIPPAHMLFVSALCVVAVAADLAQYIVGYWNVSRDYERAKRSPTPSVVQFSKSKARRFCFVLKIVVTALASAWLLGAIFWGLLNANFYKPPAEEKPEHRAVTINIFIGGRSDSDVKLALPKDGTLPPKDR